MKKIKHIFNYKSISNGVIINSFFKIKSIKKVDNKDINISRIIVNSPIFLNLCKKKL